MIKATVVALGAVLALSRGMTVAAAPTAELWPRWTQHDPAARATIDHATWNRLLKSYVVRAGDGVNRFTYRWVTADDRPALDGYIGRLGATAIGRFDRDEQRAFWINLYNALTIKLVLERYPVASIMDIAISPGLFAPGPWGRKLVTVDGEAVSLDDIEHRILRPIWRDPRLHYAVNCVALGCPNLQAEAFTAANAERLLDAGARAYVNHERGVWFERGQLHASSIYKWFADDFGGTNARVIAHLREFASPDLARRLAGSTRIASYHYDWRLNDTGP